MNEQHSYHNDPEKLREENEFLKLKLMLEHGADLGGNNNADLPPEVEHQFLTNVLAFEKQYEERKTITVFDKIGRPGHFKATAEIGDNEIEPAWIELREWLNKYGIDLGACSKNVSTRELYRFTVEELFNHEMDDISLPGWITHFIYDEFHPDPVYDNTRTAVDFCINMIFRKEPLEWMHHYTPENIRLNEHFPLDRTGLQRIINRFKACYDEIRLTDNEEITCSIEGNQCIVSGNFTAEGIYANETTYFSGDWCVLFRKNEELEYWDINEVEIKSIPF